MKKLFLLFALVSFAALGTIQAQCHGKKSASTTEVQSDEAAAKLASMDETIERRVCEKSGTVSYWKKETCAKSGNVSFSEVSYDSANGQFVNVSPSEVHGKATNGKSCCAGKSAGSKASCSGAEKASASKASCSGAAKAGCCSSKKASAASTQTSEKVKVQAVSSEGTN
ncbi:MAG: hypothetical protein R2879_14395 [Saprospiraceae bacterium]